MVLVDTSVWVSHFRAENKRLQNLLEFEVVFCHPLIIGELACGNIKHRAEVLSLLEKLPAPQKLEHQEVLLFIDKHHLMGKGLGFIDAHLLAAVYISGLSIWTEDKSLQISARHLGVLHS